MNSKKICLLLPLAMLCLSFSTRLQAQEQKPEVKVELPKVVAVEFYADWCASCKVLIPKFNEAKSAYQSKAILFARFDLTNDSTKEQASYFAAFAGLEEVYRKGGGRTGFVVLIDGKTKKVIKVIGKDKSVDEIKVMINEALAGASS